MSDALFLWYGIWVGLLIAFLISLYTARSRKLYLLYFAFGALFGFYFDIVSVASGYYSYADLLLGIYGVPLSMTIAEGFSVAIVIRVFEILKGRLTGNDFTSS
ncbi:MAG: hypothetical protein HY518_05660 [Candidatus Aenigmarchaeota archaeon]|nr:hypothetical protein [Candidatus Aenigmarchaeota archaeon]